MIPIDEFMAGHFPARWWRTRNDGRIECLLCPRRCKLAENQHGFCVIRRRWGSALELASYGWTTGFQVDPIEKKPLYHFLPGTSALSFGTVGCNLGCRFCQNWQVSRAALPVLHTPVLPDEIPDIARSMGCRAVAFTFNDPIVFAEFAIDVAKACGAVGINTVAVTAGYISEEARADFFSPMSAANIDLKGFSDEFYRRMCYGRLQPVLDTLRFVHRETNVWLEVTTLLIPDQNDTAAEIDRASDWFAAELGLDVPWHFTGYHPDFKVTLPPTPVASLLRAREIARSKGIRYVYAGNHPAGGATHTWCTQCGALLIERLGFVVNHRDMRGNRCVVCGQPIPGRFDDAPQSAE